MVLRKLHLLRIDPAVEEVGFDVAEFSGVNEEFLNVVRDSIKSKSYNKFEETTDEEDIEAEKLKA